MFKRHDLLWLNRDGWQAALAAAPARRDVFSRWQRQGWPVVVRRHDADSDPARDICAGIALPPDADGSKPRIGLRASPEHIERSAAPLPLKAAAAALPAAWQSGYAELQRLSAGLDLRVYGSLAWQALTGLPCLGPNSDIDILFRPLSLQQLHAGLALLGGPAHNLPLDGEIMFPTGQAVSWKEWLTAGPAQARVLVKDLHSVRLAAPESLLATLRPA